VTTKQYLATHETNQPRELAYGIVREPPAPFFSHQQVVIKIVRLLADYVESAKLGVVGVAPLDVILDDERALIVQPDLIFIAKPNAWIVRDRVRGAPDLVIEVLSPNPRIGKTEERVTWFAEYGVRECWLVHVDRREITVITYSQRRIATRVTFGRRHSLSSSLFPDFTETFDDIVGRERPDHS